MTVQRARSGGDAIKVEVGNENSRVSSLSAE